MRDGVTPMIIAPCRRLLPLVSLAALVLAGCGSEQYEERLRNTATLFAHEELLKEHLQGKWSDSDNGIDLRIPHKFEVLPPPVPPEAMEKPAGEEGEKIEEEEVEVIDDRQPKYLNVELPGLRGAFRADVKVIADNHLEVPGEAWIYVLSNQDLADRIDEAKEFNMSFVKTLAAALQISPPQAESFESVRFPARVGNFVSPVKYTAVVLKPEDALGGLTRQFSIYLYDQGDVQVIVLFVLPQNVDGSEKLTDRVPLCLETLKVHGGLVHKTPGGFGGGAAPKEAF